MIDYQNISKTFEDNILQIDTERFYREAEDYFFYFNRADIAIKLLKSALALTPNSVKTLKLLGDIYFSNGKIKKAFDYYTQAAALNPSDTILLSSVAIICDSLKKYQTALNFINLAFDNYSDSNAQIYAQMCDLKFSLLIKLKQYEEAKIFLKQFTRILSCYDDYDFVISTSHIEELKKKISLRERMKSLNIKVVG